MRFLTANMVLILAFSFCPDLQGQVATALLRESESLPGDNLGSTITAISNTATNGNGGYAFTVITDGSFHHIWGREDRDTAPDVFYSEGLIGDFLITSFESFF